MDADTHDDGYTLIELLIVIIILGVLATVVVFAVSGLRDRADTSACAAESSSLVKATSAYFVLNDTASIPDAGGAEGYEQTLVNAGLLRTTADLYDVDGNGDLVANGSGCPV